MSLRMADAAPFKDDRHCQFVRGISRDVPIRVGHDDDELLTRTSFRSQVAMVGQHLSATLSFRAPGPGRQGSPMATSDQNADAPPPGNRTGWSKAPPVTMAQMLPDGTIEIRHQSPGRTEPDRVTLISPQHDDYQSLVRTLDLVPLPSIPVTKPPAQQEQVGIATMLEDGALQLQLRSVEADGTIAEALLTVFPQEARYASMLAHLGPLRPGQTCKIRPFPDR